MGGYPAVVKVTHVAAPVRAQAVEAIRAEIISGVLSPGQKLVERELCERLDVSRNTLREACRQLEAEGFLVIPPHKGPTVARLTDEEARAVYEVREALECFAVRLFVERASDEQLIAFRVGGNLQFDARRRHEIARVAFVRNITKISLFDFPVAVPFGPMPFNLAINSFLWQIAANDVFPLGVKTSDGTDQRWQNSFADVQIFRETDDI